jgi:prevent-host-death family protein
MRAVGLKTLKNKLAEYIRLVAAGETVLVTDRDRVVAEIVPPGPRRSAFVSDALLAESVSRGLLTPPVLVDRAPPRRSPRIRLKDLLSGLERDRSER